MRERLIEILSKPIYPKVGVDPAEVVADYLLDNGVIVPPCKVGDKVYQTDGTRIYESEVRKIIYDTGHIAFDEDAIGKSVFLSRDEAEKALAERSGE